MTPIQEIVAPSDATEEEKKQIQDYNKMLKEGRKVELVPLYEPLILNCDLLFALADRLEAVSYTHLDVYKRQPRERPRRSGLPGRGPWRAGLWPRRTAAGSRWGMWPADVSWRDGAFLGLGAGIGADVERARGGEGAAGPSAGYYGKEVKANFQGAVAGEMGGGAEASERGDTELEMLSLIHI